MGKLLKSLHLFSVILIIGLIIIGTINAFQVNKALISPTVVYVEIPYLPADSTHQIDKKDFLNALKQESSKFELEKRTLFDNNTLTYLITLIISSLVTLGIAFLARATLLIDEVKTKFNGIESTISSNETEDTILSASEGIYFITLILYSAYITNSSKTEKRDLTFSMCHRIQRLIDRIKSNLADVKKIDRQNKEIIVNHLSDALSVHKDIQKSSAEYRGAYIEDIIEQLDKMHKKIFELKDVNSIKEKSKFRFFWKKRRGKF